MATPETNVKNECFLAAGSDPAVLMWRQQVGIFRAYDNPDRIIKAGMPGQSDSCMAVCVEITPEMVGQKIAVLCQPEFKRPKGGRQSPKQKDWQKAIEQVGGIYRLIRSADELKQLITDVKSGKWRQNDESNK